MDSRCSLDSQPSFITGEAYQSSLRVPGGHEPPLNLVIERRVRPSRAERGLAGALGGLNGGLRRGSQRERPGERRAAARFGLNMKTQVYQPYSGHP